MKENGWMTTSMDKECKVGWMAVNTKDSISKARRTVRGNTLGKMVAIMWEPGKTTKSTDMVPTYGQMADSIRDNG